MYTHLVLLLLLTGTEPEPARQPAENYGPPAMPELPAPLYSTRPPDKGLCLMTGGDSFAGPWWGCGWRLGDGSVLAGSWGRWAGAAGLTYRKPICETESFRCSVIGGTQGGVCGEWYLGCGFAARLDLQHSLTPFRAGLFRASLDWYPVEGVCLSIGLDALRGTWSWRCILNMDGIWMF